MKPSRRRCVEKRRPTLIQPESAVAMAMPVAPIIVNSMMLSTTLAAMAMPAKTIGVLVSSRAKKLGCSTLIST